MVRSAKPLVLRTALAGLLLALCRSAASAQNCPPNPDTPIERVQITISYDQGAYILEGDALSARVNSGGRFVQLERQGGLWILSLPDHSPATPEKMSFQQLVSGIAVARPGWSFTRGGSLIRAEGARCVARVEFVASPTWRVRIAADPESPGFPVRCAAAACISGNTSIYTNELRVAEPVVLTIVFGAQGCEVTRRLTHAEFVGRKSVVIPQREIIRLLSEQSSCDPQTAYAQRRLRLPASGIVLESSTDVTVH